MFEFRTPLVEFMFNFDSSPFHVNESFLLVVMFALSVTAAAALGIFFFNLYKYYNLKDKKILLILTGAVSMVLVIAQLLHVFDVHLSMEDFSFVYSVVVIILFLLAIFPILLMLSLSKIFSARTRWFLGFAAAFNAASFLVLAYLFWVINWGVHFFSQRHWTELLSREIFFFQRMQTYSEEGFLFLPGGTGGVTMLNVLLAASTVILGVALMRAFWNLPQMARMSSRPEEQHIDSKNSLCQIEGMSWITAAGLLVLALAIIVLLTLPLFMLI